MKVQFAGRSWEDHLTWRIDLNAGLFALETYVHWLPKKDRPRGLVGGPCDRQAASDRKLPPTKIGAELCPRCAR
ncbi:hypothetical protein SAMN05216284_107125 [Micromonospora sediminimaris]|uniref:Uncharacterized protein n=1 Tax=Micromonospora sediminimaris TaxID=547162 RepID=A0A9W5UVM3_9ACTN|nr:hypothetical protein Vse01_32130 [Micromonospora sediminimaris]SFC77844.1 hypothetical protein SAMN05216284_107125 [Micromonospora sediminimaris]